MTEQRKRGRPTEAAKDVRIYARMTEQEKRRFMALGGSKWLRKQIADSDVREVK